MLQLQCMVQFQPVNLAIVIQGTQNNGYQGVDPAGHIYQFRRL